jgi:RNA-directed DNA polymerase
VRFPRATYLVICCRSRRGAERVLKQVTKLLEAELGLKVHPNKTKIVNHEEETFDFLGHVFKPGRVMKPSIKSMKKFKERIQRTNQGNYQTESDC